MNGRRSSRRGLVEAPELKHLGVDLCLPPFGVRLVELGETLVGVAWEGLQRSVRGDKRSRLSSGFRFQGSGNRISPSGETRAAAWVQRPDFKI